MQLIDHEDRKSYSVTDVELFRLECGQIVRVGVAAVKTDKSTRYETIANWQKHKF